MSIASNTFLIAMKLVVGFMSGSVSIISEAIHSVMDLVAAIIAFFSVKIADIPPDESHPYGHGKVENVSGVMEALLIFAASIWIIEEAIKKIIHNEPVEYIWLGSLVMFISAGVNILVSRKLYKVAKKFDSIALEADALHLKVDVYTSLGVALGLFLIWLTGYHYLDPVVAICIALFILKESFDLLKKAFNPLLDYKLSDEDLVLIKECIEKEKGSCYRFHEMRSRKAGNKKYVDLHLEVPKDLTVESAHALCDRIERDIERNFKNMEVLIHVEPCQNPCESCEQNKK